MLAVRALCLLAFAAGGCGGPVRAPAPPSGELIAFGGGPNGARDACFSCHGLNGQGDDLIPRLAGVQSGYIVKQLNDYAAARRADAIMIPIAARLSDRDMRAVAAYYASLAPPPRTLATPPAIYLDGDPARSIAACARCHGERGQGQGSANPAIAGQPAEYTAEQLRRWRASVRRNDARDVMGRAARQLTDTEIDAVAAYLEGAP
jgi:cytochrome c553